ncbi:arginine-specific demethylase JMJ22-like [Bidens hawaiensis]|uniref:arginine-specific demethylase JMJ22-like n=1 Tax=Bidens hawaiensis TaxID=980011 RepID=UPI00404A204F
MFACRNLLKLNKIRKKKRRKPHKSSTPKPPKQNPNSTTHDSHQFSLKSQSLGVQPLGNFYLTSSHHNTRNPGLGTIKSLTDELILDILGLLEPTHLGVLSSVSKSLYVFCNHEPIWKNLVLACSPHGFLFKGSWKSTFVAEKYPAYYSKAGSFGLNLKVQDFYSDYLFQSWLCANLEMKSEWLVRDNIIRRKGVSVDEFVNDFEALNKLVLIEGCLGNWGAMEKWDRDYLVKVCGDARFSVGPTQMTMREYFVYADQAHEERPLYLFDPGFANKVKELGRDYETPVYFNEDLFSVLGNERPDYRWIIIGPAGSGSSFHIDPNSTLAWNAVVKGSKKWVLFPPDVVPPGVYPSADGAEVACPVSITEWFMNFYEATKTLKKRPVECVCKAGEVIFVPNGWWHLVINLEDSIAITQNFVSRRNLLNVLEFLKKPNASTLVSGTRDRVNLHDKFKKAIEASFPGTIDELAKEAEKKKTEMEKPSFWDSVKDSNSGGFKFSF